MSCVCPGPGAPGAEPWYDHDYIITLIGGRFYDQRAFNRAYLWGKLNFDILPALKSGDSLYRRHMSVPGKDI